MEMEDIVRQSRTTTGKSDRPPHSEDSESLELRLQETRAALSELRQRIQTTIEQIEALRRARGDVQ